MNLLVAAALLAAPVGTIIEPVANMHSRPAENSDVVSQAILGSNVELLEEDNGWVKVRTGDAYTGWIRLASLRRLREGEKHYASGGRVAQVESLFANLYPQPDVTARQPVVTVAFETRLEVVSGPDKEEQRWLEVRLPDERRAWVQRGDISFRPERLNVEDVVALARRFLGLPYLWGGTSSFGFDCSGFTQMLCRRRGVIIPRDAAPQARWDGMAPVERSALQPGDLVYFGESAGKITHSGMYIGGGEFIHATTHGRPVVQISRLDDPHWSSLLAACRRLK